MPQPSVYRYRFADLLTGTWLAEVGMTGVSFGQKLNDSGTLNGTIHLSDWGVQEVGPKSATAPGRTGVYVDRNGVLVWGGLLWTRDYKSLDQTLDISAQEFLSYFDHRYLTAQKVYTNVDQLSIVTDLVNFCQGFAGGNIGVSVPSNTSGVLRSETWNTWDYKQITQAWSDLSAIDQGFDIAITVSYSGGAVAKALQLGYPRLGRVAPNTGLVWEYPGANVDSYEWPEDATLMASSVYEIGKGSGATMLTSTGGTPSLIDAGYPVLEAVYSWKDVDVQANLDAHAVADAKAFNAPVPLPKFKIRSDRDPQLGAFTVGDDARFRLTDQWFPATTPGQVGYDGYLRIVQLDVRPQDTGAEDVELTVTTPPP